MNDCHKPAPSTLFLYKHQSGKDRNNDPPTIEKL